MDEPGEEEKRRMAERAAAIEAKYAARGEATTQQATPAAPVDVSANDQGGELTLNVDDTNKLRAALGLKPLNNADPSTSKSDTARDEHRRHQEKQAQQQEAKRQRDMRERLAQKQAERNLQKRLARTKALGQTDEHGDDILSWVSKHKSQQSAKQEAAAAQEEQLAEAEETEGMPDVRMKSSAANLNEGETMILTLADANILDDEGEIAEDGDVLEDFSKARESELDRKKRAATKQGLHFEEDRKQRSLLDKYDEEEQDLLLQLDAEGHVDDAAVRAAIQAQLAEDASALAGKGTDGSGQPSSMHDKFKPVSEYLTEAEAEAGFKKKRKGQSKAGRKGKRKRETRDAEEDEQGSAAAASGAGGVNIFDELEAAGAGGTEDRGSRAEKQRRQEQEKAQAAEAEAQRAARYAHAIAKANLASIAARQAAEAAQEGPIGTEEEDEEFARALKKARAVRQRAADEGKSLADAALDHLTENVKTEGEQTEAVRADEQGVVSDTMAFLDALKAEQTAEAERRAAMRVEDEEEAVPMDEDMADDGVPDVAPVKDEPQEPASSHGLWTADDDDGGGAAATGTTGWTTTAADDPAADIDKGPEAPGPSSRRKGQRKRRADDEDDAPARGQGEPESSLLLFGGQLDMTRGLANTLCMVRERGWLQGVDYKGRMTDFKGGQRERIEEALLKDDSELAMRVSASLQRKDEYGRVLTPKEAFRDVSYAFHGYIKAASKKEKTLKTLLRDRAQAGLVDDEDTPYNMSRNPSQLLDAWKAGTWKPKWVKRGEKGRAKAQKAVGDAWGQVPQAREAAAAATAAAAAAAAASTAPAARVAASDAGRAGTNGDRQSGAAGKDAMDKKLMPPPPPAPPPSNSGASKGSGKMLPPPPPSSS